MISERNFTKASALSIQAQADETQNYLRKMVDAKNVKWDELITILARNTSMLNYAASELHRVCEQDSHHSITQENVIRLKNMGKVH